MASDFKSVINVTKLYATLSESRKEKFVFIVAIVVLPEATAHLAYIENHALAEVKGLPFKAKVEVFKHADLGIPISQEDIA